MGEEAKQDYYECCPICSSQIVKWRTKNTDTGDFTIYRCGSCGYAFVNPRPSLRFLTDHYSSYGHGHNGSEENITLNSVLKQERRYPNSTIDARRILRTSNTLNPNGNKGRFLDVGCGYGFFSKEALGNGFEVVAIELASKKSEVVNQMTTLSPLLTSFEEFEYATQSFSEILMSQALEHAIDVNLWIDKARNLLESNGILAIAVPNFSGIFRLFMQENDPYICPPEHLNFFSPNSLSRLLKKHGFKVEVIQFVSRIQAQTFVKHCPRLAARMLPVVNVLARMTLKAIDMLHMGIMINVYARKANPY